MSFAMGEAVTPVSSRTSRTAVCSACSPASTRPLGRASTVSSVLRFDVGDFASSRRGSMTATQHFLRMKRMTTPPAEISRTMFLSYQEGGSCRQLRPRAAVGSGNRGRGTEVSAPFLQHLASYLPRLYSPGQWDGDVGSRGKEPMLSGISKLLILNCQHCQNCQE